MSEIMSIAPVLSDTADFVLDTTNIPANAPVKIASSHVDVTSDYATATFKVSVTTTADSPDGVVYAIVGLTGGTPPRVINQNLVNQYPIQGGGATSVITFPLVVPAAGAYTSLTVELPTYGSNIVCMQGTATLKLNIVEISRPNNATWNPPLPAVVSKPSLFFDPSTFVKDDANRLYSGVVRAAWAPGTSFGEGFFVTPKSTAGNPSGFDYEYQKIWVNVQDHDHTTGAETYHPGAGVDTSNPGYHFVDVPFSFPPPTTDTPGQFSLDVGMAGQDGTTLAWYWKVWTFTIGQWYTQCPADKRPLLSDALKPIGKAATTYGVNTGTGLAFKESATDWSVAFYQSIKAQGIFQHCRINAPIYDLLKGGDYELSKGNLDSPVQNALLAGLTPILTVQDLHAAIGQDASGAAIFVDLTIDDLKKWWTIVANLYLSSGNNGLPYVIYDLLNEPHQFPTTEAWLPVAKDLCALIRGIDPNAYIIVPGANYEESVLELSTHWSELRSLANAISAHPYVTEPNLAEAIADNGVPLWIGETQPGDVWNAPNLSTQADVSKWIGDLEAAKPVGVLLWTADPNAAWEQKPLYNFNGSALVPTAEGQMLLNEIKARQETGAAYVIPPPPPTADEILEAKIDAAVAAQLAKLTLPAPTPTPSAAGMSKDDVTALVTQLLASALKTLPPPATPVDLSGLQTALQTEGLAISDIQSHLLDVVNAVQAANALSTAAKQQATLAASAASVAQNKVKAVPTTDSIQAMIVAALNAVPVPQLDVKAIAQQISTALVPVQAELAGVETQVAVLSPLAAKLPEIENLLALVDGL